LPASYRQVVPEIHSIQIMSKLKSLVANLSAWLCSRLIYFLHNRKTQHFNRLELQSVLFSYSQFGEDIAVLRLADRMGIRHGIYVDAGAFHPIFGSNTLLLHKAGWRGINIDLATERIATFNQMRPRDHNVAACLSDGLKPVQIAHYEIPSTDRIVGDAEKISIVGGKPIRLSEQTTTTLTAIIDQSLFKMEDINYLNIDCEGHDLAVLRGLDMNRCRPSIVTIEAFDEREKRAITEHLSPCGYDLVHDISPVLIFALI
jgi:hypothetical protein